MWRRVKDKVTRRIGSTATQPPDEKRNVNSITSEQQARDEYENIVGGLNCEDNMERFLSCFQYHSMIDKLIPHLISQLEVQVRIRFNKHRILRTHTSNKYQPNLTEALALHGVTENLLKFIPQVVPETIEQVSNGELQNPTFVACTEYFHFLNKSNLYHPVKEFVQKNYTNSDRKIRITCAYFASKRMLQSKAILDFNALQELLIDENLIVQLSAWNGLATEKSAKSLSVDQIQAVFERFPVQWQKLHASTINLLARFTKFLGRILNKSSRTPVYPVVIKLYRMLLSSIDHQHVDISMLDKFMRRIITWKPSDSRDLHAPRELVSLNQTFQQFYTTIQVIAFVFQCGP
jgi:hypothetical protein